MSWWSRLCSGLSLPSPPVSVETKISLMLQHNLTPCFSFKRGSEQIEEHFLVLSSDHSKLSVLGLKALCEFGSGTEVLYTHDLVDLKWANPSEVFGSVDVDLREFRMAVDILAASLCYDRRVKVFTNKFGVDFYVSGGFNHNSSGFSVEVPCDAEWCQSGWVSGFVHYAAVPYYQGNWHTERVEVEKPNFVYYDWMGDRISAVRLKEKQARDHENLSLRLQNNIAQRKILDADMADILQRLNRAHVHE